MDDLFHAFRYYQLVEYNCQHRKYCNYRLTPKFSKKIPGSLIAIIVVTVAVYLMKTYAGINCIDTIGDRFSIKAELPDAVMPSTKLGGYSGLISCSHYHCGIRSHRIAAFRYGSGGVTVTSMIPIRN